MSLSETLQRLRKERGLSQEDVAEKLYVSRQSVSKWENGAAEPGVDNLKALAKLYGVTLDELVGNDPPPEVPAGASGPDDPEGRRTWLDYRVFFLLRLITVIILYLISATDRASITIPFDLMAMLAGFWITAPAMWWVIIGMLGLNFVLGLVGLVMFGGVGNVVAMLIDSAFAWLLTRPVIKARFYL